MQLTQAVASRDPRLEQGAEFSSPEGRPRLPSLTSAEMESRSSKGAKKARKIDQFLKTHFGGNIKDGSEEELAEELQMPGTPNELRMR